MTNWRQIFFLVNFSASMIFVVMCVIMIVVWVEGGGGGSPFALLGGVCFVWPALAVGVAEWLLYMRKVTKIERPLGTFSGLIGIFAIFALVANAAEAIADGGGFDAKFWLIFGGVCLSIATYGFWCGWIRLGMQAQWRIKRGLCPACAYPVGISEGCTECGKPVVKQKTETQKADSA